MKNFVKMLKKLQDEPSITKKKEILDAHRKEREIISYALDPNKKFYITSSAFTDGKYSPTAGSTSIKWTDTQPILDRLHARTTSGSEAKEEIKTLLDGKKEEHTKAFLSILDKHLVGANVGKSLADKVLGMNTKFKVALADKVKSLETMPFTNTYGSRKLDGIRCLVVCNGKSVKFYSRQGKEFTTLSVIGDELKKWKLKHKVIDGEICIRNKDGSDDFTAIVSVIKKKGYTIDNPILHAFDIIDETDFWEGKGDTKFSERYYELCKTYETHDCKCDTSPIKVLPQVNLSSPIALEGMVGEGKERGWEGIMLRDGDSGYEGKRTKALLKVKSMQDAEFKCIGVYDGLGQFRGTLGGIEIEVHGHTTRCGSGFSKKQRVYWHAHPQELIGKKITIQYFEESKDSKGTPSLRFPVFKAVRNYE